MTTDPTTTDHDNEREWATRFLDEWARPYFGDDANDAVAAVIRAVNAVNAAETTPTQPTGRDHDHAREALYELKYNATRLDSQMTAEGFEAAFAVATRAAEMPQEAADRLIRNYATGFGHNDIHHRWHISQGHGNSEDQYAPCDECRRRQDEYDRARQALMDALIGPAAAVAAERERIAKAREFEDFDAFVEAELSDTLLVRDGHGTIWTAFEANGGAWWAVRPRHEDDEKGPDGDEWRPVGLVDVQILPFPLTAVEANDVLANIARSAS